MITVKDAIQMLERCPPDLPLVLLDADTSWQFPVLYIGTEKKNVCDLHEGMSPSDLADDACFIAGSNCYADTCGYGNITKEKPHG